MPDRWIVSHARLTMTCHVVVVEETAEYAKSGCASCGFIFWRAK